METEEKYLKVLNVAFENSLIDSGWKASIFNAEDWTCSTNGWIFISVPKFRDFPDHSDKVGFLLDRISNVDIKIELDELKGILGKVPLTYDDKDCPCCNGEGEVEYEFEHNGKAYTQSFDCPVCHGDGCVVDKSAEKVMDSNKAIKIGNCYFNPYRIKELIQIAEIMGENYIRLVRQIGHNLYNTFKIGDVYVVVMPSIMRENPENVFELQITE